MSELEIIETHRMPDGTEYRAALRRDPDPQEPYDEGGWPILRIENARYSDYVATAFNQAATPYVEKFNELFERVRQLRTWERYAKIFLGATRVHEWGFNRVTDYSYIAFDAKAWRMEMDMDTPSYIEKLGEEDPLAEITAWLEGDVYGRIVHTRYNPDDDMEDDEGWTDFEDGYWVWGFYGRKWAEEEARSVLADAINDHKQVHRYTEHEKIDAHDSEIRAILEFLETHTLQGHTAVRGGHQQMVFEHFGIDYKKIEEERELMFKRLQMDAAKQAGLSIQKAQEATDK